MNSIRATELCVSACYDHGTQLGAIIALPSFSHFDVVRAAALQALKFQQEIRNDQLNGSTYFFNGKVYLEEPLMLELMDAHAQVATVAPCLKGIAEVSDFFYLDHWAGSNLREECLVENFAGSGMSNIEIAQGMEDFAKTLVPEEGRLMHPDAFCACLLAAALRYGAAS